MAVYAEKAPELHCPINDFGQLLPPPFVRTKGGALPRESAIFNGDLAKIAAVLSLSAADEAVLAENLRALGYGDLYAVRTDGERDRIGIFFASRIRAGTLETAVVLKETTGDEWYSNFDVGYSAEHEGFGKAADFAEEQLGDYIFTRAIGMEPRFFVTGYSRGAAAANILAKRLCDRWGTDGVCAYTLASPAVTLSRRQARYSCIFNLVREEDFFTRIPLESWGYTRYGRDLILPESEDFEKTYRALTGEEYIGFKGRGAAESLIAAIRKLAPNVRAYYRRRHETGGKTLSLYEFMSAVAGMLAGHPGEAGDVLINAVVGDYGDLLELLSSGADVGELLTCTGTPKCSVADTHSPAAYLAALSAQSLKHPTHSSPKRRTPPLSPV